MICIRRELHDRSRRHVAIAFIDYLSNLICLYNYFSRVLVPIECGPISLSSGSDKLNESYWLLILPLSLNR